MKSITIDCQERSFTIVWVKKSVSWAPRTIKRGENLYTLVLPYDTNVRSYIEKHFGIGISENLELEALGSQY